VIKKVEGRLRVWTDGPLVAETDSVVSELVEVLTILKDANGADAEEWISVKDRLPEIDTLVTAWDGEELACLWAVPVEDSMSPACCYRIADEDAGAEEFIDQTESPSSRHRIVHPTYWRPRSKGPVAQEES